MCGIIIVGQGVAQVIISIQEELNMENCKFLNLKNMNSIADRAVATSFLSTDNLQLIGRRLSLPV